jgi:ubiquinone biosynthesis protein
VFVKLGQMLSTRGDLLPDAYRAELVKLQNEVAPVHATAIAQIIREDLGATPEDLFAFFDPEPLGSASIGRFTPRGCLMVATSFSKFVSQG